jgi:hypothetical protein
MERYRFAPAALGERGQRTGVVPDVPSEPAEALDAAVEALSTGYTKPQ